MSFWATAKSRKVRSGKRPCSARFTRCDNLVAIVDYNRIQLDGFVNDIMEVDPLADKWRAFGWHVIEVDGHNIPALQAAFAEAAATKGKPTVARRPHRQGQRRLVHGEQSQIPWHGAHPGRSGNGAKGAGIMATKTKFELKLGHGHARGLRQGAGRAGRAKQRHCGAATRTFRNPPIPRCSARSFRSASFRMRHRRGEHGGDCGAGLAYAGKIPVRRPVSRASSSTRASSSCA